ncbi:hypothetical protein LDENG_00277060 [Lucifuga dentata]|nr:hypothetical protein LDENG_00277060 [Lucifuga dentata]
MNVAGELLGGSSLVRWSCPGLNGKDELSAHWGPGSRCPPLVLRWDDMGFFMSTNIGGIFPFALGICFTVFLCFAVSGDSADVKCENIYKDFSECVLELGDSMDNYQENVTSERGVEAVCSHWEDFHTCALTALSDCQDEGSSIWESLRQDSRNIRFQGSLFELCSPSSSPSLRLPLTALFLPLLAILIITGPNWSSA